MVICRKLSDVAEIWSCSNKRPPDDKTIMIQRVSGTKQNIGRVFFEPPVFDNRSFTKEPNLSSFICMKPKKDSGLSPLFLASTMNNVRRQGYWEMMSIGTVQQFIRLNDVKKIPCRDAVPMWFDEDQISEYIVGKPARLGYFDPRARRRKRPR